MKTREKAEPIVHVTYVEDPEKVGAAMAILKRGLHRALQKIALEASHKAKRGVA